MNFVNFQETLKTLKDEVEELNKVNPQLDSKIDEILLLIEEFQTTRYTGYVKRFYEDKISEIRTILSRLKYSALKKRRLAGPSTKFYYDNPTQDFAI